MRYSDEVSAVGAAGPGDNIDQAISEICGVAKRSIDRAKNEADSPIRAQERREAMLIDMARQIGYYQAQCGSLEEKIADLSRAKESLEQTVSRTSDRDKWCARAVAAEEALARLKKRRRSR